jgi:uncharacterized protein (TIGR02466 family)
MPNIVNAFPLSIYRDALSLDAGVRERMVEAVLDMGLISTSWVRSPDRTWTGDVNGFGFLHQDRRFAELFAAFSDHLRCYLDFLKIDPEKIRLYYTRSWATISQGQESISPHRHRQSHISLVYYLTKPANSGGISFTNREAPNQFAPNLFNRQIIAHGIIKESAIFNTQVVNMDPEEGDLLIFPSMTQHGTAPNLSGEPRLSIAVDIVMTIKDAGQLEFLLPDLDRWTPAL